MLRDAFSCERDLRASLVGESRARRNLRKRARQIARVGRRQRCERASARCPLRVEGRDRFTRLGELGLRAIELFFRAARSCASILLHRDIGCAGDQRIDRLVGLRDRAL